MISWPEEAVMVRVPATSANLGPGFDALGLALTLYDDLKVRATSGGLVVEASGEGADTADAGEDHLIVRAMRATFAAAGSQPPGLALRCVNRIPHGRGSARPPPRSSPVCWPPGSCSRTAPGARPIARRT